MKYRDNAMTRFICLSACVFYALNGASMAMAQQPSTTSLSLPPAVTNLYAGATEDADYIGGRGLINLDGVSGMFLNPTSGTLPEGAFTAQYCVGIYRRSGDNEYLHTSMLSYGLSDWLEVGAAFRLVDQANVNHNIGAGGPLVRARLLKDEDWCPELSVGWVSHMGYDTLDKHTLFLAASKRFAIDEDGGFKAFRLHAGMRQLWQDSDVNEANGSIGFIGGEFELPMDVYLVAEVSNKDDLFQHTPYSFGLQWRPSPELGFSFAGIQSGNYDRIVPYLGIGITFGR
jgi:hypothetical protein